MKSASAFSGGTLTNCQRYLRDCKAIPAMRTEQGLLWGKELYQRREELYRRLAEYARAHTISLVRQRERDLECHSRNGKGHSVEYWVQKLFALDLLPPELYAFIRSVTSTLAPSPLKQSGIAKAQRHYEAMRHTFIAANLSLVIFEARKYLASRNWGSHAPPFDDLIQEGNIGLMRAVDKFDYRRSNSFSTYASWWIKKAFERAKQDKGDTIRIPVHLHDFRNKIIKARRALASRLGHPPSAEEVSLYTGVPLEKIRDVEQFPSVAFSLQDALRIEDRLRYEDVFADVQSVSPFDQVAQQQQPAVIERALCRLSPSERYIIREYYLQECTQRGIMDSTTFSPFILRRKERQARKKLRRNPLLTELL